MLGMRAVLSFVAVVSSRDVAGDPQPAQTFCHCRKDSQQMGRNAHSTA